MLHIPDFCFQIVPGALQERQSQSGNTFWQLVVNLYGRHGPYGSYGPLVLHGTTYKVFIVMRRREDVSYCFIT